MRAFAGPEGDSLALWAHDAMSASIISVEDLGKRYRIRHQAEGQSYVAFRDVLASTLASPFRRVMGRAVKPASREDFWALRDVSFDVKKGEVVGIIGRNGAGKSTLLKILSRITEPTEGRVRLRGRVASLLEVGTGFHPELTGRENIFLNGAILGMARAEILRKFDEIVAFAEIEKFLDTPVKRYSSGMYVRLAFAVAAHLEPEILIVDEVLAVGDAQFQKKSLGKMKEVARGGRTVLFVSHNLQSVSTLTEKALLLNLGKVVVFGPTNGVIGEYIGSAERKPIYEAGRHPTAPGIEAVRVTTSEPGGVHVCGKALTVTFAIFVPEGMRGGCLSFQILNQMQEPVIHLWLFDSETPILRSPGFHRLKCTIPTARLYMGRYSLKAYFTQPPGGDTYEILDGICPFEVVMHGRHREFPWQPGTCSYLEDATWSIQEALDPASQLRSSVQN